MGGLISAPHWKKVDRALWDTRWPNFSPKELASKGDGSIKVTIASLDGMQYVRRAMGRWLKINSCYRDPLHNARVGGAPRSRHKISDAWDISTRGMSSQEKEKLYKLCREAGFTGFGFYNSFLHVDMARKRSWGSNRKAYIS